MTEMEAPNHGSGETETARSRRTARSLFRDSAIKHRTNRLYGDVLVFPSVSQTAILVFLCSWAAALFYLLATTSYFQKEYAQGWLEPTSGVSRVYPDSEGVVDDLFVSEGDFVRKGQPLLVLGGNKSLQSGEVLEEVLLTEYSEQRQLVLGQLQRSRDMLDKELTETQRRIEAAEDELALLQSHRATVEERYSLALGNYRRLDDLRANGFVTPAQLDEAKQEELELKSEQQQLIRLVTRQENLITELRADASLLPDQYSARMDELGLRLITIARETAEVMGRTARVIEAPRDGIVSNLQIYLGQIAKPGAPILSIVPRDATLLAHVVVPVRAAGLVDIGQTVEIRYDSFPYQSFGVYEGTIVGLGDSVVLPGELITAPVQVSEPVYRILVELKNPNIVAHDRELTVRPGMTFVAVIRLEERKLIQWLLGPLLKFNSGFQ